MLASWPVDAARLGRRQDEVARTRTPRCDRMSGPRLITQIGAAGIYLPGTPSRIRAIGLRTRHTDRCQRPARFDSKESLQRVGPVGRRAKTLAESRVPRFDSRGKGYNAIIIRL